MKMPTLADRHVKVSAFLTDETFGYTHWQAKQFLAPEGSKPALLVLFDTAADRESALTKLTQQDAQEP